MTDLETFAAANDAAVIFDRDGDVAVLRRHYDADGRLEVRYAPDPCDYRPTEWWAIATEQAALAAIC